jgi:hypothetical protein
MSLKGLIEVFPVPVQGRASAETGEQVVETSTASDTNDEEAEGGWV